MFLSNGAACRLHLVHLPSYASDLNPDEGGRNWPKNVEMKNLCCRGLDHLKTELWRAKERLRHKIQFIKRFSREIGLVSVLSHGPLGLFPISHGCQLYRDTGMAVK